MGALKTEVSSVRKSLIELISPKGDKVITHGEVEAICLRLLKLIEKIAEKVDAGQ